MPPKRNKTPRKEKEEPIGGGAMADCVFPEDILLCILTRLPVKSILRFKSVCKPWRELFHTPEFVKMYQGEFSSDPKKHSVIFYRARERGLFISTIIESTGKTTKTIHDRPYRETHPVDIVIGCCNGLICLGDGDFDNGIVLWNPALKLYKFIRAPKGDFVDPCSVSLGFGYDSYGDDFKVVRIVHVLSKGIEMGFIGVEVYSADSGSWTTIELGFRFSVFQKTSNFSVNGNPYWFAIVNDDKYVDEDEDEVEEKDEVLVCFDVRKMVFKIVPLPAIYLHHTEGCVELVDWKGNLGALWSYDDESGMCTSLGVWVLDDGEGIWRKIHTLGPIQGIVDGFTVCLKNGKLVGKRPDKRREVGRCKRLKFVENRKLIVFDPDNGCVEEIVVEEARTRPFRIYGYTESLVQVKGMIREAEERELDLKRSVIEDLIHG